MALSHEEVGFGPDNRGVIRSQSPASFPRVSPALQAERDVEAQRLRVAEQDPAGGGLIPTSSVIAGAISPKPAVLSHSDVGFGGATEAVSSLPDPSTNPFYQQVKQNLKNNPLAKAYGAYTRFALEAGGVPASFIDEYKKAVKDPIQLITQESLPANLYKAWEKGVFDKSLSEIVGRRADPLPAGEDELAVASRPAVGVTRNRRGSVTAFTDAKPAERTEAPGSFTFAKLVAEMKKNPGKFMGDFQNALIADPYLIAAPGGAMGALARPAALAGGRAAGAAGRAIEGGLVTGALNASVDVGQQLEQTGELTANQSLTAAAMGAGPGALLGGALGRTPRPARPPPFGQSLPRLTDQTGQRRAGEHIPAGERSGFTEDIRRAQAKEPIEGEWTRVEEEVRALSSTPPEARTPAQTQRLLTFNRDWARENALPAGTAAALAAYTAFGEDPESGLLGLGLLGAMKAKGGMWHPKAVETVARPLQQALVPGRLLTPETAPQIRALNDWAITRSQSYLNKHMGTETDPLRAIEIPDASSPTGTRPWGEVTDALVSSTPAKAFQDTNQYSYVPALRHAPPEEPVWGINRPELGNPLIAHQAAAALKSYLSHVGDFLRENVPAEKLSQYDLVRAVRETAKRDVEMAKAMEREAGEATKDLPVYKDYGDGFRWVELKLPEKLTEGQGKTIRPVAKEYSFVKDAVSPEDYKYTAYEAIGSDGKPIQNTYTGDTASGRTPEEAYLAGQLAREGNQMGHCVGGYCEGVASGESRIFSLRDAKGKSHVTVEVEPWNRNQDQLTDKQVGDVLRRANELARAEGEANYKQKHLQQAEAELVASGAVPPNILQIKGKQNRAPVAEYQKYVQDFVKEGKWGEVSDLENTGLVDLTREARVSRDPKYARDHQEFLDSEFGGERFVSEEALGKAWARWKNRGYGPIGEQGKIDPKLLIGGAAAGGAALLAAGLSDDKEDGGNRVRNMLLAAAGTAALTTVAGRAALKKTLKGGDYITGMVSTRIKNISEPIWHKAVDYEWRVLDRVFKEVQRVAPQLKQLPKAQAQQRLAQIHEAAEQLERGRMFGRHAVFAGGPNSLKIQMGASIGNMAGAELRSGRINKAQHDELVDLLKSRHMNADKPMPQAMQHYRNITNAMLLGGSAPIQLGDAFVAAFHQGILPSIVGVVRALGPNKPISARDIGLAGHIAQDIDAAPSWSAKILDKTLRAGLFTATDRFGKNVNLNAALFKAERLAKTPAGIRKLQSEYGAGFGADFPQLISDLQAKNRQSAQVKSFLFHEISDAQPVSKLEITQAAMDKPDLRLAYQLKSFALKQLDIARRDVAQEAKKGHYGKALERAMSLAMAMGLSGMGARAISDFIFGNEVELDQGAFLENIAKTYFMGEYTRNAAAKDKVGDVAGGLIVPPYKMWEQILKEDPKAISYLGLPGKLYYQWGLGGREREEERREKLERKREREE